MRRTSDFGRRPPFLPVLVDRTLTTRVVSLSAVTLSGSHRDPAASAPWRRVGVILGVAVHSAVGIVALPAKMVSLAFIERLQKPFAGRAGAFYPILWRATSLTSEGLLKPARPCPY